ncbi:MAG: ATP-binding cassette domain-containing protein [Clostridia bacterium]|nr:ATP-binding cassette domain-containing protein [Clostridia bacterium]
MENFSFKNVSFAYPLQENRALREISFEVSQGEFLIFCGPSGCGKSTLLRHFKTCLTPHGTSSGEILFNGKPLYEADERTQAQEIGFVMQSPDNQIVTDKVWHELAFGLESLGYDTPTIRRRVAETAAFFGIEDWFYKNVNELSGGQKQLLSLASVIAMNPKILVLDEPTAQLDPIAATDFIALLGRINRELGITVILSEHRLEEAFPFATRVIVMEKGEISCDDTPEKVGLRLREKKSGMFLAMPTAMRVWAGVETKLGCPLTVREGSDFLTERNREKALLPLADEPIHQHTDEIALECKELWFRYEKNLPDVVKGFSLTLHKGEFYAILGGNGAGKTTALKVISGLRNAYRGTVKTNGKVGMLPQNPQTLFVKKTVREDLYEALCEAKLSDEEKDTQVSRVAALCRLGSLLERHPYDISGGEQQRAALAKVLLTAPDILLMDEPTKGFDAEFKAEFAAIIDKLTRQGITVLTVSHDVAFCAEYAHRCGLFFDGSIVAQDTPRKFFSGNCFYTTPANRMARHLIEQAVTVDDIIACCGGNIHKRHETSDEDPILPKPDKKATVSKPKAIKPWRKLLAAVSGLTALGTILFSAGLIDLSAVFEAAGISAGNNGALTYIVLFTALAVFALAVGRQSEQPPRTQQKTEKKKPDKRITAVTVAVLLLIPLTIFAGVFLLDNRYYNVIALLVLFECMLPFFLVFEGRRPKARELVLIAVLCAIGVAGRGMFFMLPQVKPVLALTIIAGVAFGGETGFLVGAITMLASNMLFSQGPWTPWQMFATGIIGFLAGVLFKSDRLNRSRASLAVFGVLAALIIYGTIMNTSSAFMFSSQSITLKTLAAYYAVGFPMDIVHAVGTAIFILLAAEPMLEKLERIKIKYGLIE